MINWGGLVLGGGHVQLGGDLVLGGGHVQLGGI